MAITTRSAYKVYAGIPAADTSQDSAIDAAILTAVGLIEGMCGRPAGGFETGTWTEFFDGNDTERAWLKCWPVTAITSVSYRDNVGAFTTIDSTSYRYGNRGELYRTGAAYGRFPNNDGYGWGELATGRQWSTEPRWDEGTGNYRAIYTGGYATIPAALAHAVHVQIDGVLSSAGGSGGMQSESIGDYSYTRADPARVDATVRQTLKASGWLATRAG